MGTRGTSFRLWKTSVLVGIVVSLLDVPCNGSADEHPWGMSRSAIQGRGALVIAGGGRMPESVFEEFVKLAGGRRARLVIIPTAHPFEDQQAAARAYGGWHDMGARSVDFFHAEDEDEANDPELLAPLETATGVWIGGGDQGRLADRYVGTRVERALLAVLRRGGVVGGTSAGASAMSQCMIRYGSPTHAKTGRGFEILSGAVVDQHFLTRRREPRLLGVLTDRPDLWGVGVDERTALVVEGYRVRVVGESKVVVMRAATAARPAWRTTLEPGDDADLRELLPK